MKCYKIEIIQKYLKDNIQNIKDVEMDEMSIDIKFEDSSRIWICFDVADICLEDEGVIK